MVCVHRVRTPIEGSVDSEQPTEAQQPSLKRRIAHNSIWYAIEVAMGILATLATTIIIARLIGPQRLGYFNYIYWLANTAGGLASLGIPATTGKYMAEYLAGSQKSVARAIFFFTLRVQGVVALVMTAIGLTLVLTLVDPAYRIASIFLVITMLPQMLTFIPSQANVGSENLAANTRGAFAGTVVYVLLVALSLSLGWDLLGIACAIFVSRCAELAGKLIPVLGWIRKIPAAELPPAVKKRMISFSGQNMILLVLNVVVWDRSDMVFLKMLQSDTRQLAFFSVAFSIIEKLLLLPQTFAAGVGASQLAEYGRDRQRLLRMTTTAARYVYLCGLPMLAGAAAISGPLIGTLYGPRYLPMIRVFQLMAIFAIPRVVLFPAYNLLLATENQKPLVIWNCICGVVDVLLDLTLIPVLGALGAASANGIAQTLAAVGVWVIVARRFSIRLDIAFFRKLSLVCAAMAAVVLAIAYGLHSWQAVAAGIGAGIVVFVLGLRFASVLASEDRERLLTLERQLPERTRSPFREFVKFIAPHTEQAAILGES
jgi:O-antigen/teichoic acid export membrane protein